MKKSIITLSLCTLCMNAFSQGGITPDIMKKISEHNKMTVSEKALQNALARNDINSLAVSQNNQGDMDTYFTYSVPSNGITDQMSSGRCWLFTGLNVIRSKAMIEKGIDKLEFSQIHLFFYDQLEKSNLFLQAIIDTSDKGMDDKTVEWLFRNPLSDGGTFTGVADLISKYGLVPKGVMPETYSSNNTSRFTSLLKRKLREFGITLREKASKGASKSELETAKTEMLGTVYHMLKLAFGEPVKEFKWAPKDKQGKYTSELKEYTPMSFSKEMIKDNLTDDYIMLMNDPSREYWKTYEIEYDRHVYDGHNWRYLNLPIDVIKEMAIASIKDSTMMYFSCDVGKCLDSKRGLLDTKNYDYSSLFGTTFNMDKKQRIMTFDSSSSHAMTLMAVEVDSNGKPTMWKVENSWGAESGYQGHLIMTDEWFDEYMFRLVINKKYATDKVKKAYEQKATKLPCWDPMFSAED